MYGNRIKIMVCGRRDGMIFRESKKWKLKRIAKRD